MSSTTIKDVVGALRGLRSAIICSHVSPDSDAVGSSCGLGLGLKSLGTDVTVYLQDGVPEKLRPLVKGISVTSDAPSAKVSGVIGVDTATKNRVGEAANAIFALGEKTFDIDHHISNPGWAEINYIDAASSSSAEIVLEILEALGVKPSPECATLLYAGLMDDTGAFRFGSTTAKSFRAAAKLVELGASPSEIAGHLHYSVPLRAVKLKALTLAGMQLKFDGKLGIVVVTNEMLKETGCTGEDAEGLIEEVRSIDCVRCAVMIRQIPDKWKVSLRSKIPSLDVNAIAGSFGGGGHAAAAGFSYAGSVDSLKAELEKRLALVL